MVGVLFIGLSRGVGCATALLAGDEGWSVAANDRADEAAARFGGLDGVVVDAEIVAP